MFLLLLNGIDAVEAGEELRFVKAVAGGMALGISGDDNKVQKAIANLIARAYPERYDV